MSSHFIQTIPFWVAAAQWFAIPLLIWLFTRRRRGLGQSTSAMLLEAIALTAVMSLLVAAPLWLLGLLPLRGERWAAYMAGIFAGGGAAIVVRSALGRRQ